MEIRAKKPSRGIVSWSEEERPRERLLSRGPQALTDAELLAILVRVGFQGTNAVELGRQLLRQFGTLRAMAEAPFSALLDVKGLKGAKVAGPRVINASETIVDGSICVENYHAILEHVKSSIRDSLTGCGGRVAVLN